MPRSSGDQSYPRRHSGPLSGQHVAVVHEAASVGYSRDTLRYHRSRPTYHPDLAKRFASRYGQGTVVELGAGTGIFTRQMVDEGLQVIAFEPVISMRTTLADAVPEADIRVGSAEKIPMDDCTVDTVVASQSFHWFDGPAALDEIHRVLAPGGHLVTVWNVRDESVPWMAEFTAIVDRHAGSTPRYRSMAWRRAIHGDERFSPVDEWRIPNPRPGDAESVIDRALSISFISGLPDDQMAKVGDDIRALVEPLGPTFEVPYESQLQAWRRQDLSGPY